LINQEGGSHDPALMAAALAYNLALALEPSPIPLPDRKARGSATLTTRAVASAGPTSGIASSRWLAQVVRGYFAYHAVPTNSASIGAFRHHVVDLWRCSLSRRSQRGSITWQRIKQIAVQAVTKPVELSRVLRR